MGALAGKAGKLAAALGLIIGAAGCLVVALCFALYAALKDYVTPAGASAIVVLLAAALMGVGALVLVNSVKGKTPKPVDGRGPVGAAPPLSFADRALDFARDKPLIAAGAAVAAGLLALRNPTLIGAVVGAVTARASQTPPPRR